MAGPLRGGGSKGLAIKEKITFLKFLLPFKNKNYFTPYRNMDISH